MNLCELRWQDPLTYTYLGSPSLVRLPGGRLIATHDYFGPGCPRNHEDEEHLTSVYRSDDNGRTWLNVTHIANAYWSTLFVHQGALYLLGCSQQFGSIVIRRSDDEGRTWTHPRDEHSGLLFRGGPFHAPPNYSGAPVPIQCSKGRLYRAFEDTDPYVWGCGFQACVISVPEEADLLEAANWLMSNKLPFDPAWLPPAWGKLVNPGWLEGNIVETPEGNLWNILRFHSDPLASKAAIVQVHDNGKRVSFNPANGFINFPGGMSKFTIRWDPVSHLYWTLINPVTKELPPTTPFDLYVATDVPQINPFPRNVLALYVSNDLRTWRACKDLIVDDSGLSEEKSSAQVGFQYADWQFDGDDIIYLVRTAYGGAHNFHDSNRITFHRLPNFRDLI